MLAFKHFNNDLDMLDNYLNKNNPSDKKKQKVIKNVKEKPQLEFAFQYCLPTLFKNHSVYNLNRCLIYKFFKGAYEYFISTLSMEVVLSIYI